MPAEAARWSCLPYSAAAAERLSRDLGLSPTAATILVRRGHRTPAAARAFLSAAERHDPFAFAGMRDACELVLDHVQRGSRIVVHGDYDVDGVCSTAIVVLALRALGADPSWHLPSRFDDGYGLVPHTVERLAAEGTGLLITTDCAITAVDEVGAAVRAGIDVLVTDHHRPGDRLPDCPIVHPTVSGYPFPDLCAAGVALKLSEALRTVAGADPAGAGGELDLAALATIADVVPLVGENRRIVREGVRALAATRRPGLRALMRIARVEPGALEAHEVAFRLAPRMNAAGRLRRADAALELVLTEDEARAEAVADELDLLNRERRDVETRILFAAEAERTEQAGAPAYVLAGEGWHPGVIGIVASRMVERHHRPCVLIALDGDGGRGSGRSIPAFDLHAGLASCAAHLEGFGGHRVAAGLQISPGALAGFREAFQSHAAATLTPSDLVPVERVDAVVPAGSLGLELAEEIRGLGPFGQGNPEPTLLVPAATVRELRGMGEDAQHSRFTLACGGARARAVAFRTPPRSLARALEHPHDAVVRLEAREWEGAVEPRVVVRSLCATEPAGCSTAPAAPFWPALKRELDRDLDEPPAPAPGPAVRTLRDRRGEGFTGVAVDLLSSGEPVAVVCADPRRRAAALGALVAGGARACRDGEDGPGLAVLGWEELAADPTPARPFAHLVALDPPAFGEGRALLAGVPADGRPGFAHLAWGPAEAAFALAVAEASLDLRPALAEVYRALRAAGGEVRAGALVALLQGPDAHARPAAVCGRLVRVLGELGLTRLDTAGAEPTWRLVADQRTDLDRSPAHRAYLTRLAEARSLLSAPALARVAASA